MGNVTFTETKPGTGDPETGLFTSPTESTVVGDAFQKKTGDFRTYERLKLVPEEAPTLFFVPDTYGEKPVLGSTVVWPPTDGETFIVKSVRNIAPDGIVIASDVVIAR